MSEEEILSALRAIAFSDFTEYIWVEDGTVRVKDSRLLTGACTAPAGTGSVCRFSQAVEL